MSVILFAYVFKLLYFFQIIYTVELIDFKPEDEDECKTFEYKKTIGNRKRERGNFWFKRNEYNLAIQLYRKALEYLDENHESMEPSPVVFLFKILKQSIIIKLFSGIIEYGAARVVGDENGGVQ